MHTDSVYILQNFKPIILEMEYYSKEILKMLFQIVCFRHVEIG